MLEQEIIMQKYSKIIKAIQKNSRRKKVALLARTLTNQELVSETGKDVLRVISDYAYAMNLLDRYDHGTLAIDETTRQQTPGR
jgi:hypothetical protein